ncbi:MAG: hypothetical protein IID41_00595 [Planctomycetes bacterium]|nr:hypothetical protein [Planctomycetota bacterium]
MGTPEQPALELDSSTRKAISRLARDLREDAQQEAYVAILEGKDPRHAVREFGRREQNRRRRTPVGLPFEPTIDDLP